MTVERALRLMAGAMILIAGGMGACANSATSIEPCNRSFANAGMFAAIKI